MRLPPQFLFLFFVFSRFAAPASAPVSLLPLKWAAGLYLAGILAHFSHHLALGLPAGMSLDDALISAPVSLVWPADLIGTLIALT